MSLNAKVEFKEKRYTIRRQSGRVHNYKKTTKKKKQIHTAKRLTNEEKKKKTPKTR